LQPLEYALSRRAQRFLDGRALTTCRVGWRAGGGLLKRGKLSSTASAARSQQHRFKRLDEAGSMPKPIRCAAGWLNTPMTSRSISSGADAHDRPAQTNMLR
jgi:hypothetical protein